MLGAGVEVAVKDAQDKSMNVLQKNVLSVIPCARRYGRALTGDTNFSDSTLAKAAASLIKHAPPGRFLLPKKMLLPWLLLEFHKQLDSQTQSSASESKQSSVFDSKHSSASVTLSVTMADTSLSETVREELLYEKFDIALRALSELQRRVYLLTTVERFKPLIIARILSIPRAQVQEQFQQAHLILIKEYVAANPIAEAA